MNFRRMVAIAIVALCGQGANATEPNNTFAAATLLGPSVRTVSDSLFGIAEYRPDTLMGVRDGSGTVYFTDDDGSPLGSGSASGVQGLSTNPGGGINFVVTGFGDESFAGQHSETGKFQVFVNVYDGMGAPLTSFDEIRMLTPGQVQNFSYTNSQWANGTFDAFIDNTIDSTPGDVDFFTFTGLAPGTHFIAKTILAPSAGLDTYMGWFDNSGAKLAEDDGGGGGAASQLEGMVPGSGKLTFAVTGDIDHNFDGSHFQEGNYQLELDAESIAIAGDYNGDGSVNAADYVAWRDATDRGGYDPAVDGNGDNALDVGDYTYWRARYGNRTGNGVSLAAVPEPETVTILLLSSVAWTSLARRAFRRLGCRLERGYRSIRRTECASD